MHTSDASSQSQRAQRLVHSAESLRQPSAAAGRGRSEESWVEIASQPSSSSLSSAADEIVTTGLRVTQPATRRPRRTRTGGPIVQRLEQVRAQSRSAGDSSSQEEYEESESESDRVMTSSNEGLVMGSGSEHEVEGGESDDENRTAVNYPIRHTNKDAFTPQPNAFSHPPTVRTMRHASEPCPGSYFPQQPTRTAPRPAVRHSFSAQQAPVQHSPWNAISPSHNAAAHHDAALRASLSTLLSCAAAARGLPKSRPAQAANASRPTNRVEPGTFRLIPGSALPNASAPATTITRANLPAPSFLPTIRQQSSTATSESAEAQTHSSLPIKEDHKRKNRESSKTRSSKKRRPSSASSTSTIYSAEDMLVSPTLLTWIVSAGVVVVLSAISFTAGYVVGHEAGRVEGTMALGGGDVGGRCAEEVGRSGLRRLRFAVQA